jgi:cysteine synthase A
VLRALRMDTGLVHLEFRLTEQGPVVMEVAVRTPGDFLMDLLGLTYGCDWYELVVRAAVGWPLPAPPVGAVRYAASYLPVADPGVVVAAPDADRARAHPDVAMARSRVAVGDVVPAARSSAHRVGHVVLASSTPAAREAALAQVRRTFAARTEPGRPTPLRAVGR